MPSLSTEAKSYDAVPFPVQPVPPSDPDRLAAVAMLFGMRPHRVDRARVLELGCASGGNLLPLAERFPNSTFVGVDFSERQIGVARQGAESLGLNNIELRVANVVDIDEALGTFDYIIAHGFYSWVSPETQQGLLSLCKRLLAPQGVAYASYNTYPGWCLPNVVREVVCNCTSGDEPIELRLDEARKVLGFFSNALGSDSSPYALLLKGEIDRVLENPDGYLAHEHMGKHNSPVYFHEFVERAASHGLQYLGDSLLHSMFAANLGRVVEQGLTPLADDAISIEQHIDLLRNRAFRMSLLCHDNVALTRKLGPECLRGLYFSGRFHTRVEDAELKSSNSVEFVTVTGTVIAGTVPVVNVALNELGRRWPASLSLDALVDAVARRLSPDNPSIPSASRELFDWNLLELVRTGYVQIHSQPGAFVSTVSDRPQASQLARVQAQASSGVTNRRHEMVRLDEVSQKLLTYLDGKRDRAALVEALVDAVACGQLSVLVNGMPIQPGAPLTEILQGIIERSLAALALDSLLVG